MSEFAQMSCFRPQVKKSLEKGLAKLCAKPQTSFSRALGKDRDTLGHLLSREDMTNEKLLSGHIEQTIQRAKSASGQHIVAVQDTTSYNYTSHKALTGLGSLHGIGKARGLYQHNVLIMNEDNVPLGVLHQAHWTRGGELDLPEDEKETVKWFNGLAAVNTHLCDLPKRVVLVQDREADIFDFFAAERAANVDILLRVHEPRNMEISVNGVRGQMPTIIKNLPLVGVKETTIHEKGKTFRLTLELRAGEVTIFPPNKSPRSTAPVQNLSLVVARETNRIDTSTGESIFEESEKANWILVTSLPINNLQEVCRVVDFYAMRWRVETFHFTLKSGCFHVEKLQVDDIHTLVNSLTLYSIAAWQVMALTFVVRSQPDMAVELVMNQEDILVLSAVAGLSIKTVGQYVLALSGLVEFKPTKKQPYPGVKILSEALTSFQYVVKGFRRGAAKEDKPS